MNGLVATPSPRCAAARSGQNALVMVIKVLQCPIGDPHLSAIGQFKLLHAKHADSTHRQHDLLLAAAFGCAQRTAMRWLTGRADDGGEPGNNARSCP